MKIVSIGYSKTGTFSNPEDWLSHISFYTGLLEALASHGTVSSLERINYEGVHQQNGVTYHFVRLTKTVERFPYRLHRVVKQLRPDVVLVNGFCFPLQLLQLRLVVGKSAKILVLHRAEKPARGRRRWLQFVAASCVDAYLLASLELGRPWIESGCWHKGQKMQEVLQASSSFQPKDRESTRQKRVIQGNPVYLWVGRLEENKDPLTVVRAFLRFWKLHPAARLFLIFQTEELLPEIKALILEADAAAGIVLVGKMPHPELEDWYSCADFFLSGSHEESCGIAVLEAISCGCIPVVTDIASFRKITANCGLRYRAGDVEDLLVNLQKTLWLNREEEREKLLHRFQTELSFPALAQKITDLLHHLS